MLQVAFCEGCGRVLDQKINKRFDAKFLRFCNQKCKDLHERNQRPKNKPKYGVAGVGKYTIKSAPLKEYNEKEN